MMLLAVHVWPVVLTVLILAAAITLWAFSMARWRKFRGGCGSCSTLTGQCCLDDRRDPPAEKTPTDPSADADGQSAEAPDDQRRG